MNKRVRVESWELSEFPPFLVVCGSFTCCCGNIGVKQILNCESAQKVDPRQIISPSALTTELSLFFMRHDPIFLTSACWHGTMWPV